MKTECRTFKVIHYIRETCVNCMQINILLDYQRYTMYDGMT
jgi:hypothetical protein